MDFDEFKSDVADAEVEGPPRQVMIAVPLKGSDAFVLRPVEEMMIDDDDPTVLVIYPQEG